MGIKKCCIQKCKSSTTRNEDKGVTYHKFPKDSELWHSWVSATHYTVPKSTPPSFVCSRHFCKDDFKKNKDSKYILKSDAIPSIFSWDVDTLNMEEPQTTENEVESKITGQEEAAVNTSSSSKGSDAENLEAIKNFIEADEEAIQDTHTNAKAEKSDINLEKLLGSPEKSVGNVEHTQQKLDDTTQNEVIASDKIKSDSTQNPVNIDEDTMAVATSVMEMILNETEANAVKNKSEKYNKQTISPGSSNMPLSVGSKVEAKDFSEEWYPAEIAEVDCDEMEVLVHYDNTLKKSDEWINVSSPRLRQYTGTVHPKPVETNPSLPLDEIKEEPKEIKVEDKSKVYVVGERCLARWRDNRRFVATIEKDLGDGKFEVIFDDGVHWICPLARLSKLKESRDILTIDTTVQPLSGTPSPVQQGGPSSESPLLVPTYSTHLFDPTIDYLGSKSERREKKRKLNIKEIFNIGQKKPKLPKIEKEKVLKEKKANVKNVKPKVIKMPLMKAKTGIPDAVASIIGTITKDEIKMEMKSPKAEPMDVDEFDYQPAESQEENDSDPVEDEDKLERFDKPDLMHEEVIDKIKEAIIKLEGGLNESAGDDKKENAVKLEVTTPKREIASPKSVIDTPMSAIDMQKPDTPKPDIETPQPVADIMKIEVDTLNTVTDRTDSVNDTPILLNNNEIVPTNEETIEDTSSAEFEDQNTGMESPRLDLEASEAEFNLPAPDSDATVSDIELGNESPRIELDSQSIPILVDIDAPLDNDPSESQGEDKSIVMSLQEHTEPSRKSKKKLKRAKKLKALDDETVQAEVERVKSELAAIKMKVDDMKAKMRRKKQIEYGVPLPESCLLPGEWACRWVNGQPVGRVSEMLSDVKPDASGKPALPRRSVEVQDKRLPPGWTKHMVRRSVGNSAGKWDVVLISPSNKRFHTKTDMRNFLESADETTKSYEHALLDFGVHLKLARKLGWIASTPDGVAEAPETILPAGSFSATSPLVKKKSLSLKRRGVKLKDKKRPIKLKLRRGLNTYASKLVDTEALVEEPEASLPALEDGFIWVGSLKVQVIENLLRCPADGCFKNFRNNTLLKMHIKHYHRDLCRMLGATPKVLDLAAARTKPTVAHHTRHDPRIIRVKINKPQRRDDNTTHRPDVLEPETQLTTPTKPEERKIPRSQDSPKLRNALNKLVKRPRVLLPMKRVDPEDLPEMPEAMQDDDFDDIEPITDIPDVDVCDFETAISTHTVTKPADKRKGSKKQKSFASFSKNISEDEEWFAMNSDDVDTRSSFPRSSTPDSKIVDSKTGLSDLIEDQSNDPSYTLTESEKVKIVHMKREEIINCHCGIREEDGLMVQCELCLCWQHALCHNIQKECDVPDKYTCSICLNPRRGRRAARFLHDQDRLYEGLLPGAKACESLRRSHELSGNLLRIEDALHALRVKYYVATKKDHPKLYLWAKDWEQTETYKLNSEYSPVDIHMHGVDKENHLPLKPEEPSLLDIRTPSSEEHEDRYSQREGSVGSQALLSGLLSSPSAASLELPISTSELERLAKTVQEAAAEWQGQATAPQPEAAIDNDVCRDRLLKHIQRCQALLDSRLDSIEAQVAELESQEPSFAEHYETAEHYPRIKQTVEMLMRDLDTMEELGVIT